MINIDQIMSFLTEDLPKIAQASLMLVGGLKVVARYTPWKGDDQILSALEAPIRMLAKAFPRKKKRRGRNQQKT